MNVDRWRDVLGDRLLILDFLDIQLRPAEVMKRVGVHLGCGPVEAQDLGHVNANPRMSIPREVEDLLVDRYASVLESMRGEFPLLVQRWANLEE